MIRSFKKYGRDWAVRLNRHASGNKGFDGSSVEKIGLSSDLVGTDNPLIGADADRGGDSFQVGGDATPYADNDDVEKIRFRRFRNTRLYRLWRHVSALTVALVAYLKLFIDPKLSRGEKLIMAARFRRWDNAELEDHRQRLERERIFNIHRTQAQLLKVRLVEVLTNLGFCYHITKNERKYIKKKIKVTQVDVSPYAYTFHITRVPFGVKLTEMAQDWVSTEIAATIGKKIRYDLDLEGLRYTVEVGSTLSIPNFVGFGDLDDKHPMPKNLPPLAFWAGLTANGSPVYRDLAVAPHMIIAGSSGGGKSNMENTIACTLLRNNTPDKVRMVFFDLKGGVEFSHFEGIQHLWPMTDGKDWNCTGIVEYPSDVIPALNVLFAECMSRLRKLKKAKVKNINEYNRGKKHRIPYIVVFFDEWASTKKLVGNEAEAILSNIANLSRSAGIHFILATQYPKAEIINTTISVNFPWRIAFNMPSGASQSVLGDWGAVGLNPVGRAVLLTMADGQMQIQTPRITNQNVLDVAEEARTGVKMTRNMENVDVSDILEWAINNTGGKLDGDTLFNQFKGKIARLVLLDILKAMDNQVYDVAGVMYKVKPGVGNMPRSMELTDERPIQPEISERRVQSAEILPEIEPEEPEIEEIPATPAPTPEPHTCESCGAQALCNPCEYCGKYIESEEKEYAS